MNDPSKMVHRSTMGALLGKFIPDKNGLNEMIGDDIYGKTAKGFVKYINESLNMSGSFLGDVFYSETIGKGIVETRENSSECEVCC